MKVKNLSFVEKYIEKIVLGLALLFSLGVLWLKFTGEPYRVAVGSGDPVPPADVEQKLLNQLRSLEQAVADPKNPLPMREFPPFTEVFVRDLVPRPDVRQFTISLSQPGLPRDFDARSGPGHRDFYFLPPVPAASMLTASRGFGVLAEPAEPQVARSFEQIVGTRRPWDFRWVSVAGRFDLGEWRRRLESRPLEPGWQRIPEQWWRNTLLVTDVVLQRQMWDPQANDWSAVQTLAPLPHMSVNYRFPPAVWAPAEANQALQLIRESQRDITKPPFPPMAIGAWMRPDVNLQMLAPGQRQEYLRLQRQIEEVERQISQLSRTGGLLEGGMAAVPTLGDMGMGVPRPPGGPGLAPGRAPGGVGMGGGPGMLGGPGEGVAPVTDLVRLRELLAQLYFQQERVAGIADDAAGFAPSVLPGAVVGSGTTIRPGVAGREVSEPAVPDVVTVWNHDITAQPGVLYRYRLVVSVMNPLFRQTQVPLEQQQSQFEKLSIESQASEWTEPIILEPARRFFVVGGNPQRGTASVEVYSIFNGQRILREFYPQAGDPIGQVVPLSEGGFGGQLDMSVGALAVDIDFEAPARGGLSANTTRLLFLDHETGELRQRTVEEDSQNLDRLQMKNDLLQQPPMAVRP